MHIWHFHLSYTTSLICNSQTIFEFLDMHGIFVKLIAFVDQRTRQRGRMWKIDSPKVQKEITQIIVFGNSAFDMFPFCVDLIHNFIM